MNKAHTNRVVIVSSIILLFLGLFLLQPKPKLMAPSPTTITINKS